MIFGSEQPVFCRLRWFLAILYFVFSGIALAEETGYDIGGRLSAEGIYATYPNDSVAGEVAGSSTLDTNGAARIMVKADRGAWDFRTDYQNAVLRGDSIETANSLPPGFEGLIIARLPADSRRLFDLTQVIDEGDDYVWLHRLDRLSIGHTTEKTVIRFGRQAISWGNGLIYNPVDIFNPFDPAAVDKEYKAGDDLLYGQYLADSGNDLQGVAVFRRNPDSGEVEQDSSALAFKYHGFAVANEYDLLAAQNYGDTTLSVGGIVGVGGAVWRADVVATSTGDDTVWQFVASYTESWFWAGKNASGVLEYFYNGFGQPAGEYSPDELASNPDLVERLSRGELFTLGKHYIAASVSIEITPLFMLIPNLFINVADHSALAQVVTQNSLSDNMTLLGAFNVPIGAEGSEFGGPESGTPGLYFSSGPSASLQLNWYF